jgi:hypothetical protein
MRPAGQTYDKIVSPLMSYGFDESKTNELGLLKWAATPIINDHVTLNFAGISTVDLIGYLTRSTCRYSGSSAANCHVPIPPDPRILA